MSLCSTFPSKYYFVASTIIFQIILDLISNCKFINTFKFTNIEEEDDEKQQRKEH